MTRFDKKIIRFLFPQYSVSEVFLATSLLIVNSFVLFYKPYNIEELYQYILSLFIYLVIFILSAKILFAKKVKNKNHLLPIQWAGIIFILAISTYYVIEQLQSYNLNYLSYLDYFFLSFAILVLIRFSILFLIFTNTKSRLLNRLAHTIFSSMPKAKHHDLPPFPIMLALMISLIIYFVNIENQIIALGYALFSGMLFLDLSYLAHFKYFNRRK